MKGILFFIGAVFGSAVCCMEERSLQKESWFIGRSRCEMCGHKLCWYDLIPVISYILLRGRCRYCGKPYGIRNVIVEMIMGAAFVMSDGYIPYMILSVILCYISMIDIDTYSVPQGAVLLLLIQAIVFMDGWKNIPAALAGAFIIWIISFVLKSLLHKTVMGFGDVELYFITILYIGMYKGIFSIMLSCIYGILCIVILRSEKIPFTPMIAGALYTVILLP